MTCWSSSICGSEHFVESWLYLFFLEEYATAKKPENCLGKKAESSVETMARTDQRTCDESSPLI